MQKVIPKWARGGLVLVCERCFKERIPEEDPDVAERDRRLSSAQLAQGSAQSRRALGRDTRDEHELHGCLRARTRDGLRSIRATASRR